MAKQRKKKGPEPVQRLEADQAGKMASTGGGDTRKAPPFQLQTKGDNQYNGGYAEFGESNRSEAQQVALYMASEMNINAAGDKCAQIRAKWTSAWPNDWWDALMMFRDMVNYQAPWDHKPMIEATWGEWQPDPGMGIDWYFDVWSNIHYGYVGRACGFSESLLKDAAGFAQWRSSNVPEGYWRRRFETLGDADVFRALDDPLDQAAIGVGYHLSSPSEASLLRVMRQNYTSLSHRTR